MNLVISPPNIQDHHRGRSIPQVLAVMERRNAVVHKPVLCICLNSEQSLKLMSLSTELQVARTECVYS